MGFKSKLEILDSLSVGAQTGLAELGKFIQNYVAEISKYTILKKKP